ncbi:MAG: ATP-grasp domain-containing protein [Polyangiaceae bacterium]
MRIGIFGSSKDPQCRAVASELRALGVEDVLVRADALDAGLPLSMTECGVEYRGVPLEDVAAFYLRFVPAPYAPYMVKDGTIVLYDDWHERYMHAREKASFFVAWLLNLVHDGVAVVNAPQAASVLQYKPTQLHALRALGARVPRTLISNDPSKVRAFQKEVGDVIFKPLMGGAITCRLEGEALDRLDDIVASPVIFQERAPGRDLRVMVVGDRVVSSVAIVTEEQHLDFRADPTYSGGKARYEEVHLPADVEAACIRGARACGLDFAGIDIKQEGDDWVFLELNSSPVYLDVERKIGHPISRHVAKHLVEKAAARQSTRKSARPISMVSSLSTSGASAGPSAAVCVEASVRSR